jgi:molybdenum cofactor cytidylyltransferase
MAARAQNPRRGGSGARELAGTIAGRQRHAIVSFVGAGGKTSLLQALARHWRKKGLRVLSSTTARVRYTEFSKRPFVPVPAGPGAAGRLGRAWRSGLIPFLHEGTVEEKLHGVPPGTAARLARIADITLVEADGCRGMPLKRLRDHEPPLPPTGAVVLVVGADAFGRRLEKVCFSHEGAVAGGIAKPGQKLDPATVRRILFEPRGYLEACGARPLHLVLNKCDVVKDPAGLARGLYHKGLASVFTTTTKDGRLRAERVSNRDRTVAGILLAAGGSKRFGAPKQMAPLGRRTMLQTVLRNVLAARGLGKVFVVLGHRDRVVLASLGRLARHPRVHVVVNRRYAAGMSTSLRAGLAGARGFDASAIFLGDQPALGPGDIEAVVNAYRAVPCETAHGTVRGRRAHPVIIGKELYPELRRLRGDVGARAVVEAHRDRAAMAELPPGTQLDVDHRKDLKSKISACRR